MLLPLKGILLCQELAFSQEKNRAPDALTPFAGSLKRKKGSVLKSPAAPTADFSPISLPNAFGFQRKTASSPCGFRPMPYGPSIRKGSAPSSAKFAQKGKKFKGFV